MRNPKLLDEKKHIDDLFNQVNSYSGDPYIKSLLTYYLCMRISGFLENCVRIIFQDYSIPRTKENVQTFVTNKLKKFPNPTWSAIIDLALEYNKQWVDNLKKAVKFQQISSLESINVNRNAIAHGGSSSITIVDLSKYYADIVLLIEELENSCV